MQELKTSTIESWMGARNRKSTALVFDAILTLRSQTKQYLQRKLFTSRQMLFSADGEYVCKIDRETNMPMLDKHSEL